MSERKLTGNQERRLAEKFSTTRKEVREAFDASGVEANRFFNFAMSFKIKTVAILIKNKSEGGSE